MGVLLVYQSAQLVGKVWSAVPWFSISLSLNILLTLMIVVRLILHARNIRTGMGGTGIGGLCKAIVTMLVESCALYAVSSVLVIGPWSAQATIGNTFLSILPEIQVRAFPRSRHSSGFSDMAVDWSGHRPIACHPASRQQERIHEHHCRIGA